VTISLFSAWADLLPADAVACRNRVMALLRHENPAQSRLPWRVVQVRAADRARPSAESLGFGQWRNWGEEPALEPVHTV